MGYPTAGSICLDYKNPIRLNLLDAISISSALEGVWFAETEPIIKYLAGILVIYLPSNLIIQNFFEIIIIINL